MANPRQFTLICCTVFLIPLFTSAQTNHRVGFVGKRADAVGEKRVETQLWNGDQENTTGLMQKRFAMEEYDKHFSSLGSKRSPIAIKEKKDKKIYETKTQTFPTKEIELSSWNQRVKDLQKEARLVTEPDRGTLKKATDEKLYSMILQDQTKQYADMAQKLSLRDINKFQFRRNHTDEGVPVQKAGSGDL